MIRTAYDVNTAYSEGRSWLGFYRRGGPVLTANVMADLSYAAGIPVANYYAAAPLTSAVLAGTDGIDVGPLPASGLTKYVKSVLIMPPTACGIMLFELVDICLYYPFADGDGGAQSFFNTVSIPRYNGEGCRIMVVSQGAGTAITNCIVTYTNSQGVAGRTVTVPLNLLVNAGSLCSSHAPGAVTSQLGAYLPLMTGDTGVRSIQSVEYLSSGGGIAAFVIVKPLAQISMFEATAAPLEIDFMADKMKMPTVPDGAYLGFLARGTTGATPATIHAQIETVWG